MKFWEILCFELIYQARRLRTWLYFAVLLLVSLLLTRDFIESARDSEILVNSPYTIAATTVICSLLWVLMAPAVAGSAAARDQQVHIDPLFFTAPVSKAAYLGGRVSAAIVLNAVLLFAVSLGMLLGLLVPGAEPRTIGPFPVATYLSAYFILALPGAVALTSLQFALAALSGRIAAAYLASFVFFVVGFIGAGAVAVVFALPTCGKLLDPIGYVTVLGLLSRAWTPLEKNTLDVGMLGSTLASRLLWSMLALGILALTHRFFSFKHRAGVPKSRRRVRSAQLDDEASVADAMAARKPLSPRPHVRQTFNLRTHLRQAGAIAWSSFATVSKGRGGLVLVAIALFVALFALRLLHVMKVPLVPTTARVVSLLTAPVAENPTPWALIPLLVIFFAGELVWRERDAPLYEIADASPTPDWVFFLGKFLGLGLVIFLWLVLLAAGGLLAQMLMGFFDIELGLYLKVIFGLQLIDYLLFALFALWIHVVVNQKHIANLVALLAYGVLLFPTGVGISNDLLVFGAAPGWSYTDLRGFGATLAPWLWFKAYWAAWALLLAVAARLLWSRGTDSEWLTRIRQARRRFTPGAAWSAATAGMLVIGLGGFIFYNTNVLNAASTASERLQRAAQYEQRYKRFEKAPRPRLAAVDVEVEIYPDRRVAEIKGKYRLVNRSQAAIDSIHLTTAPEVETRDIVFDRPATPVEAEQALGYRSYLLERPLQPGESLAMSFAVRSEARGFRSHEGDARVVAQGTFFSDRDWLPAIGYQRNRELRSAGERRRLGLGPRAAFRSLEDTDAHVRERDWVSFSAVVGTAEGQTAVAPGRLQRTWTKDGRRYFQYATDGPIPVGFSFYSAGYALHEATWAPPAGAGQEVAIRIYHDPRHTLNLDRMVRGIRAALDYYTVQFGPYPFGHLTIVERGSHGDSLSAEATLIDYGEAFSLLNPHPAEHADLVFFGIAHEVSHQWWGHQLTPASVEGEVLMAEGLANYSAMQVLERTDGREHLERYLRDVLWNAYQLPRTRVAAPLLRADTPFLGYRKGAHALYAVSQYIGEERMNAALRRLFEQNHTETPRQPTALDLYRELQGATPAELHPLLRDLFEANTFWELSAERASARRTETGGWQVTIDIRARKVAVDEAGLESEQPLDDWIEVGVFGPAANENGSGQPLYLEKHRVRSGQQTIQVTVPTEPARAEIDPRHLLNDWELHDNGRAVNLER
jgi:ABC-type transport system involved in multi-copper enzyme maturation permease subunit